MIQFHVNTYDFEGDIVEEGVFLCFGDTHIKVCNSPENFNEVVDEINDIYREIKQDYLR